MQWTQPTDCTDIDPAFLEHLLDTITATMPPADNDTDQARAARRNIARMALLAMKPADPFAAMLAAQAIAAHYAIMDAFRRAAQPDIAPAMAARLRANAASLSRTMQATLRTLQKHRDTVAANEPPAVQPPASRAPTRAAPNAGAVSGVSPATRPTSPVHTEIRPALPSRADTSVKPTTALPA